MREIILVEHLHTHLVSDIPLIIEHVDGKNSRLAVLYEDIVLRNEFDILLKVLSPDIELPFVCSRNNPAIEVDECSAGKHSEYQERGHKAIQTHTGGFEGGHLVERRETTRRKKSGEEHRYRNHQFDDLGNEIDIIEHDDVYRSVPVEKILKVFHHINDKENECESHETEDRSHDKMLENITIYYLQGSVDG